MPQSRSERIAGICIYIILSLISLVVLYPLYFVLIASISAPETVMRGEVWLWPKELSFVGYERLFANKEIIQGFLNTVLYTVTGTALNLVMTIAAAYPLSRADFKGRNGFMLIIVFTMFFSGGMIPSYLLVKELGMLDTIWAMIIPSAVSVWNIIIMRTFFQNSIPKEMQEAAFIDGCSNMRVLFRIVLPLSGPILAVMVLFYAVGHWNSYFTALIYLSDRSNYPLQLFLREILVQGQMQEMVDISDDSLARSLMDAEAIKYAAVIVTNLPMLLLYPFLQKYFVKGVMIGAIKG
ncbi:MULTISPECIES: carbohydrate ABC transporter permease [Paenibacillus]|uniref:Binding-protein-dependent transport systems inner membrane component n=3 Tax=Paenibacillus TaxID=44249 RepID=G4HKF5_9BACL|nr:MULTISPECIES: carbohydrate ABC transporter permease [Paenibacillus]EHB62356.1 binding-protein-dependent transport systems inner membrane component [Paenibacillus lactis 154]MBP1895814.1 putative aldouronate transport system permease protein [Paenibacillus lactis]MCM3495938.1 carbohydrate ABC transporter permease [Paenibacillus lactis]OOC58487.1 sugar ABC transporter permease [Paenibacillus ihbetae]GIO92706.1 sugar ABC transporter permease [Paenibacillus lactis]